MRLVAATMPDSGAPPPDDVTVENSGRLAADLAARLGADASAGHSLGANVAWRGVRAVLGTFVRCTQLLPKGRVDLPAALTDWAPARFSLLPEVRIIGTAIAGEPAHDQGMTWRRAATTIRARASKTARTAVPRRAHAWRRLATAVAAHGDLGEKDDVRSNG